MSVDSLAATDVETIFEGTAPVGDKEADFEGTDSELFLTSSAGFIRPLCSKRTRCRETVRGASFP